MRWLERRRLRRTARNTPAHGLVRLFGDDGRLMDSRRVRLWQRGWNLYSEPVLLYATQAAEAATTALYDDKDEQVGHQPVTAKMKRGDRLHATWTVDVYLSP